MIGLLTTHRKTLVRVDSHLDGGESEMGAGLNKERRNTGSARQVLKKLKEEQQQQQQQQTNKEDHSNTGEEEKDTSWKGEAAPSPRQEVPRVEKHG